MESPKPRILLDFEFHFTSGELVCVTAEQGRDEVQYLDHRVLVTVRPEPGVESVLEVDRTKLNASQTTTRTVEPAVTTEDAGRLTLIGASA